MFFTEIIGIGEERDIEVGGLIGVVGARVGQDGVALAD